MKYLLYAFVLILIFSCKDKDCPQKDTFGVYITAYNRTVLDSAKLATIKFYKTEQDYLLDQNVFKTFTTDSYFKKVSFSEDDYIDYWFRITKDSLNNSRFGPVKTTKSGVNRTDNTCDGDGVDNQYRTFLATCILSTSPAKLQLNIKHNGQPVSNALVKLYYSYQDYLNNVNPDYRPSHQINSTYTNEYFTTFDGDENNLFNVENVFSFTTGADGIAFFEQLESRQYWIKVSNGTFTNSSGTIKTTNKLTDDPNVTTVLDIGIN